MRMRLRYASAILVLAALLGVAGCSSDEPAPGPTGDMGGAMDKGGMMEKGAMDKGGMMEKGAMEKGGAMAPAK